MQILELAVLLDRLADIALEDIKSIDQAEACLSASRAYLRAVTGERPRLQVTTAI